MTGDYSNINLKFSEKAKLFYMRFKKQVTMEFLGKETTYNLLLIKFIKATYQFRDTNRVNTASETRYSLTDKYYRYCIFRRRKFFDHKIWPFIISIATSIITSYITAKLALR